MNKTIHTLVATALLAPLAAAADQFSLSAGVDYSSGKYGNPVATDIFYVPIIGKYQADQFTFKLTVPYISITGPGGVIQGLGRVGPPTRQGTTMTASGLGDVIASVGYNVYSTNTAIVDLVGNVKFGTADSNKGLGTGQNDYSAQVDGYYTIQHTTLFATVGYKVYGSPPGVDLGSAPYALIGASQKLTDVTHAGVYVYGKRSNSAYYASQGEITAFLTQKLNARLKAQVHVLRGFTNGSPDYGFGALLTAMF